MAPWSKRFLLETILFRFHVQLGEGKIHQGFNQLQLCTGFSPLAVPFLTADDHRHNRPDADVSANGATPK